MRLNFIKEYSVQLQNDQHTDLEAIKEQTESIDERYKDTISLGCSKLYFFIGDWVSYNYLLSFFLPLSQFLPPLPQVH